MYTDGLTERRGADLDTILERLRAAAGAAAGAPLPELLDRAIRETGSSTPADDVALLAVRRSVPEPSALRLRFVAVTAEVPPARAALRAWLRDAGVAEDVAAELLLAAGEAVSNAVEHSGADEVELLAEILEGGTVVLTVRDRGGWKPQEFALHRGRGFALMRGLVDDVDVDREPDGTVVRLRRRLDRRLPAGPDPEEGECAVTIEDGVARVRGDLDLACAAEIRERLLAAGPAVVDLSRTTFLDSTGARVLLEVAEGRAVQLVVIAPVGGAARRTIELSGMTALLDVRDA
jgi:anti-anti-sigma factor